MRWCAEGRHAILVRVVQTGGSVPREIGASMIVCAHQTIGTIGGGHLEARAIARARVLLDQGTIPGNGSGGATDEMITEHFALGPSLGQCCGGAVTVGFRRLDAASLRAWAEPEPLFHLQLHGAGHVGQALVAQLRSLDVVVDWVDGRESMLQSDFDDAIAGYTGAARINRIAVAHDDEVAAEIERAPTGAFYLVMTHSHELDLRICEAILRRADFAFFGLIGSPTKRERFRRRLSERGIARQTLDRMCCPIGIDGIDAKTPEVIAVSVCAQLLQVQESLNTARLDETFVEPTMRPYCTF